MQAERVARRNTSTRRDVVAVDHGASDWLADAIDVNRRSGDESDDEADGGSQQSWAHQHTDPTDIQTVVGGSNPLAVGLPARSAGAQLDGGGHENGKKCPQGDGLWKGQESLPAPNVKQYCVLCSWLYVAIVKRSGALLADALVSVPEPLQQQLCLHNRNGCCWCGCLATRFFQSARCTWPITCTSVFQGCLNAFLI